MKSRPRFFQHVSTAKTQPPPHNLRRGCVSRSKTRVRAAILGEMSAKCMAVDAPAGPEPMIMTSYCVRPQRRGFELRRWALAALSEKPECHSRRTFPGKADWIQIETGDRIGIVTIRPAMRSKEFCGGVTGQGRLSFAEVSGQALAAGSLIASVSESRRLAPNGTWFGSKTKSRSVKTPENVFPRAPSLTLRVSKADAMGRVPAIHKRRTRQSVTHTYSRSTHLKAMSTRSL